MAPWVVPPNTTCIELAASIGTQHATCSVHGKRGCLWCALQRHVCGSPVRRRVGVLRAWPHVRESSKSPCVLREAARQLVCVCFAYQVCIRCATPRRPSRQPALTEPTAHWRPTPATRSAAHSPLTSHTTHAWVADRGLREAAPPGDTKPDEHGDAHDASSQLVRRPDRRTPWLCCCSTCIHTYPPCTFQGQRGRLAATADALAAQYDRNGLD